MTPRCIPLHGQLTSLRCSLCSTVLPLAPYLPLPPNPIPCPTCQLSATIRHALFERRRPVGCLRANVVLYGEEHPRGEAIGSLVERDLRGKEGKVDLLLVAGTSLAIPGIKRIVKEMARSLHSGRRKGVKVVFVNESPPANTREWDRVFDVWVKGDVQGFVIDHLSSPARKRKGEEVPLTPQSAKKRVRKGDECSTESVTPTKATVSYLPTPRATPVSRGKRKASRLALDGKSLSTLSDVESNLGSRGGEEENPFLDLATDVVGPDGG